MNDRNRNYKSGETDPLLLIMQSVDANVSALNGKVETLSTATAMEFREIRRELSGGEVRFAEHEGRMALIEREQQDCADRVKTSIREVMAEQRETDRHERSKRRTEADTDGEEVGRQSGIVRALGRLGGLTKTGILIGSILGTAAASYAIARHQTAPSTPPIVERGTP